MQRLFIISAAVWLVGCPPPADQLRTRAAFDLQCPEEQLQFVKLGLDQRGVVGCGKRETYVYLCGNSILSDCNWVSNTSAGVPLAHVDAPDSGAPPAASVYIPHPR